MAGKRLSTEEFIKRAKEAHGDKYDYSEVNYVGALTKVKITCPIHGSFWQMPGWHIKSPGCPKCGQELNAKERTRTTERFIKEAKEVHGDKYDYSKANYTGVHKKVTIICPIHGEFEQEAGNHLYGGGCRKCGTIIHNKKLVLSTEDFIERAKEVHDDKYDYSKIDYKGCRTRIEIICPIHGPFWQIPNDHINGRGCPKCGNESSSIKNRDTLEKFIEKARKVHGNKYDYSKAVYVDARTKLEIVCPKHGSFWQTPNKHYRNQGCPSCSSSTLEKEIIKLLKFNNINYNAQQTFDWLKYRSIQHLDFWLPNYNIAIECQGEQHFKPVDYFGGEAEFINIKLRDENKLKLCSEHGIRILYYSNLGEDYPYPYPVITNAQSLIDEIKKIDPTNLSDNEKI